MLVINYVEVASSNVVLSNRRPIANEYRDMRVCWNYFAIMATSGGSACSSVVNIPGIIERLFSMCSVLRISVEGRIRAR